MCAPTDALLFAEDLLNHIAYLHGLPFASKLKVWRFKSQLQETFSRAIGDAVLKITLQIEREGKRIFELLTAKKLSIASFIRRVPVNYGYNFNEIHLLVRCAWICSLSIHKSVSSEKFSSAPLDEAMLLIAEDLHKVPDTPRIMDPIWEKLQERAEELIKCDIPVLRLTVASEVIRYMKLAGYLKR